MHYNHLLSQSENNVRHTVQIARLADVRTFVLLRSKKIFKTETDAKLSVSLGNF